MLHAGFDRSVNDVTRSADIDLLEEARIVNDEDCRKVIDGLHPVETSRQGLRFRDIADADVHIVSIQSRTKAVTIIQNTHFKAAINKSLDKGRAHDTKAASN